MRKGEKKHSATVNQKKGSIRKSWNRIIGGSLLPGDQITTPENIYGKFAKALIDSYKKEVYIEYFTEGYNFKKSSRAIPSKVNLEGKLYSVRCREVEKPRYVIDPNYQRPTKPKT